MRALSIASTSTVLALALAALAPSARAQECVLPPNPSPIVEIQPDGTRLELRMLGNAYEHWYVDAAGLPVVRDPSGWWSWASVAPDGSLQTTGVRAGGPEPVPTTVTPTAPTNPGGLTRSAAGNPDKADAHPHGGAAFLGGAGSVDNLVVLIRFSNHGPSGQNRTLPTSGDVGIIMNQVGGHPVLAPTGSVRDHYLEGSYGQFTIDSTVVNWVTVPNSETYYANGNSGLTTLTWDLITDALNLVDPSVDFSQYDQDGDGVIDAITFLHSGYGAEWGGTDAYGTFYTNRMWSHKWTIPTWTSAEGVSVADYNISPGLWATFGDDPGRIGVVAHELGHFFGMPDLYDTDGSSEGIGNWCLMAAGSWGFDGTQHHPSHMSAWTKNKLGWLTPQVILPGGHVAPRVEDNPSVFRVDSGYPPGEYLLIENRQQTGFDVVIPQGGLAIWHVDESKGTLAFNNPNTEEGFPGQAGWPGNGNHYRIALLQADGGYDLELGLDRGDGGDIYHGGAVDEITGVSIPNTDAYQGGAIIVNGNSILNVGASGANVPFDYANPGAPSILTSSLPLALVGQPYAQALSLSGGNPPYLWTEFVQAPTYSQVDLGSSSYSSGGTAQGWQADEGIWQLNLPFAFPFWEDAYETVYVSSNGFIDMVPVDPSPYNRASYMKVAQRIAPMWDDLITNGGGGQNVFVDTGVPGEVRIRWHGEHFDTGAVVRFAVVLFSDGRIRFDYGSGNNGISPTVGISRGHSADVEIVAGYDGAGNLGNADSILFTPLGSQVPPGLTLDGAGNLTGTPTAIGTYTPIFRAEDDDYVYDQRALTLVVGLDCNMNGIEDSTDISSGTSFDCNLNGIPDECETDCDFDGIPDDCEADCDLDGTPDDCEGEPDCNTNGIPDDCDIAGGAPDCNSNNVPDECDPDCDLDGTPDDCEPDCDSDGTPDDCEADCDSDGTPDDCEGEPDCNSNGIPDSCDITAGAADCDSNGVPDECQPDCDTDGTPDACEADCDADGTPDDCEGEPDCNSNGIPDSCDITAGAADCDSNGVPDECQPDCDTDGTPDACEADCDSDGTPDDCEGEPDCNSNGIPDSCDITAGAADCDSNGVPDECDPDCDTDGTPDACEADCDSDGTPDDCEGEPDCNSNGIPDSCDITAGAADCNSNGIPDSCDIGAGSTDCDTNGVPDECDPDCDGNGTPDVCDLAGGAPDCDGDGVLDACETDCNSNGTPDDCESLPDCDGNGVFDVCDILQGTHADANGNVVPDICEPAVTPYCTPKVASNGCVPSIGGTGVASASSGSPFFVTCNQVVNDKNGLMFYGYAPRNTPFQGGTFCVQAPVKRTPLQDSGGSTPPTSDCTGVFSIDFNARIQSGVDPLLTVGRAVYSQYWYRDPQSPSTTGLSDGLCFTIAP